MTTDQALSPTDEELIQQAPAEYTDLEKRVWRRGYRQALAQQQGEAVAWMIRHAKTGKVYWDAECCVFDDAASANDCATDMNENIDDAEFEIFPLFTAPQAPAGDAVRGLVEKWRNDTTKNGDKHWGELTTERYHCRGQFAAFRACADELEAALAAPINPPEADSKLIDGPTPRGDGVVGYVAQSTIDSFATCRAQGHQGASDFFCRPYGPYNRPVYAHPAPAVAAAGDVDGIVREVEIAMRVGGYVDDENGVPMFAASQEWGQSIIESMLALRQSGAAGRDAERADLDESIDRNIAIDAARDGAAKGQTP